MAEKTPISPPAKIAFVGLGKMGLPMCRKLLAAGFDVHGADLSEAALERLAEAGGVPETSAATAADGARAVITMLPDGKAVQEVFVGSGAVARAMAPGALAIDMSSSAPTDTLALDEQLAELGVSLIDAPVSGGVSRAVEGTLSIIAGGPARAIAQARPVFEAMGRNVFQTGPLGSGHAMKALNNYLSASGVVAACEALIVGSRFGLEPETIIDVLNASTGRNNATELKMKQQVISKKFGAGFALGLMAKDLTIAAELAEHLGANTPALTQMAALWRSAREALGADAEHTEIYRYLAGSD